MLWRERKRTSRSKPGCTVPGTHSRPFLLVSIHVEVKVGQGLHHSVDVLVQYGAHPYQHPLIVLCSRKVLPIFSSGKMIKKESISMEDGPPCHTATLKIGCFGPIWGSPIPASSDCLYVAGRSFLFSPVVE